MSKMIRTYIALVAAAGGSLLISKLVNSKQKAEVPGKVLQMPGQMTRH